MADEKKDKVKKAVWEKWGRGKQRAFGRRGVLEGWVAEEDKPKVEPKKK